jgi:hypothetical protein
MGLFIPSWGSRGGRDEKFLVEMLKKEPDCKFFKVYVKEINWAFVRTRLQSTIKMPLYCVVEKLDSWLMETREKVSGFAQNIPEKVFLKEYCAAVDPSDEVGIWDNFCDWRSISDSGKK